MLRGLLTGAVAIAFATISAAEEFTLEINNVYPLNQEAFELRDINYFFQDNVGGFEVLQGPFDNGPARCIGAGFWFDDGETLVNGICIFGEGDDTFTMRWEPHELRLSNNWEIIDGTGRYDGMTGSGVATSSRVSALQALELRETHIIGTVDIP